MHLGLLANDNARHAPAINVLETNQLDYFAVAHDSFERALSPFALLAVTT